MDVIRKKLTPDEVQEAGLRINPADKTTVQRTYDDGSTWVDSPNDDPRKSGKYIIPRADTGVACDAAARMIHVLRDQLAAFETDTTALEFAVFALSTLLALLGGIGGIIGILFDVAVGVFLTLAGMDLGAIEAAFAGSTWDDLICTLSCHVKPDGTIDQSGMDAFYADVHATYPIVVYNVLINLGNLFGWALLSNAYLKYTDTFDCSGCSCCVPFLNGNGHGDMTPRGQTGACTGTPMAVYVSAGDYFHGVFLGSLTYLDVFMPTGNWKGVTASWTINETGSGTLTALQIFQLDTSPTPIVHDDVAGGVDVHLAFGTTIVGSPCSGGYIRLVTDRCCCDDATCGQQMRLTKLCFDPA